MSKKSFYEKLCEFILCYGDGKKTSEEKVVEETSQVMPPLVTPPPTVPRPSQEHRADFLIRLNSGEELSFYENDLWGISNWGKELEEFANSNGQGFLVLDYDLEDGRKGIFVAPHRNIESLILTSDILPGDAKKLAEEKGETTSK